MIDSNILKATAQAFEALDLSDFNKRLAKLDASLANANDAQERTRNRIHELHALIRVAGDAGKVDGRAAAEAMFEGQEASVAAKASSTVAEMRDEVAIMNEAFGELRRKSEDLMEARRSLLREARWEVARIAKPLADAIGAELRALGGQIETLHATMHALREVTESYRDQSMRVEAALLAVEPVVRWKRTVPVPHQVIELLSKLHGKGKALPVRIVEQASWPNPLAHAVYNKGIEIAA